MFSGRLFPNIFNKRCLCQHSVASIKKNQTASRVPRRDNNDILLKAIENKEIKCFEDWKSVRKEVLEFNGFRNPFTTTNIDAMTLGVLTSMKKYDLAENYINFLHTENIKLNLATLGKYFKLFYAKSLDSELSPKDEEQILLLYDNIRKTYPVLDPLTLENVIHAMSLTKNWRICLELLDEMKISAPPNANAYSVVSATAFLNNDHDLAWKLLDKILETGKIPQDIVYLAYLQSIENVRLDVPNLEKLFYFLQVNNLKISKLVASRIQDVGNKMVFKGQLTTVNGVGLCKGCQLNLQNFALTKKDFNELKNEILNNVIIGRDVFNKTTDEELQKFKNFVENMKKFDVVIDGLNVGYSAGTNHSPHILSGLLCEVVRHFEKEKKNVLVLGRNHMNNWPKKNWNYILQNSTVFLTQDLSQDDPYLLYCALNAGQNTIIVTRDLMRGHKFLLKSYQHKFLFSRWLAQRQYQLIRVNEKKKVLFRKPLPYSDVVQKVGDHWHLPCYDEGNVATNTWLCLKFVGQ